MGEETCKDCMYREGCNIVPRGSKCCNFKKPDPLQFTVVGCSAGMFEDLDSFTVQVIETEDWQHAVAGFFEKYQHAVIPIAVFPGSVTPEWVGDIYQEPKVQELVR